MKLESIEKDFEDVSMVETVEALHDLLNIKHCDFSRNDKDYYYVIEFVDKATDSILFCSCYDTPILALRELPNILEKTKSNVDNVLVQLRYAVPRPTDMLDCLSFCDVFLSPYLYFKRPENTEEVPEKIKDNK